MATLSNADLTYRLTGRTMRAGYAEYQAECMRLFGCPSYDWTAWEEESCQDGFEAGRPASELVYDLNDAYARRRADRNA